MPGLACFINKGYSEAVEIAEEALEISEAAFGSNHPHSLSNLGALYKAQGKYSEAAPLHKQALEIQGKYLKPDHPRCTRTSGMKKKRKDYRNGYK